MRIQVNDTIEVEINGQEVSTEVQIQFEAEPGSDLKGIIAAVGHRLAGLGNGAAAAPMAPVAAVPQEAPATAAAPAPAFQWKQPDLHAKAMKSVHRVVQTVAQAGGKGLTVQEVIEKARISAVPAYKMLKTDHPHGEYAARYLRTTKVGRNQVIDVTPDGRQLASLIRAGKVPV